MLDPVVKTIEVPCSKEQAFTVFVESVDSWWPKDRNTVSAMNGNVAKAITIEPRVDGRVTEIGHDDTEHRWGTVTAYDPYDRISIDWHIDMPSDKASRVEVLFHSLDGGRTRVELTHSNWEVFADKAADMRAGYDSGWVGVFEQAYRQACRS